jgi:hypothetical protein
MIEEIDRRVREHPELHYNRQAVHRVRTKREDRENPTNKGKKLEHELINENFNHQTEMSLT